MLNLDSQHLVDRRKIICNDIRLCVYDYAGLWMGILGLFSVSLKILKRKKSFLKSAGPVRPLNNSPFLCYLATSSGQMYVIKELDRSHSELYLR